MEMATRTSCERATKEEIRVVVKFAKTPRERCRQCCTGVARPFVWAMDVFRKSCLKYLCIGFLFIAIGAATWWIPLVVGYCQSSPGLDLKDVNVRVMNVYQNNTLPGTPYQANSDISVQLKAWNRNTIAGCFTTFRRVAVSVDFKGQRLLHQVVPLEGFGLKPRESRNMTLQLKGENAPLQNEIGSLLAFAVRNSSAVELTLSFAARWMQNDRKASWMSMACAAITKAPPTSSGGLLYRLCSD